MEFLPLSTTLKRLEHHGVTEQIVDDLRRLMLRVPPSKCGGGGAASVSFGPLESTHKTKANGSTTVNVRPEQLSSIAGKLIHGARIQEIVMIPRGTWRALLDLLAFELADDPHWLEVDADASLHQNGRDPLGFTVKSRHLIERILSTILEKGSGPEHDVAIASLDSPFTIEFEQRGRLVLQCPQAQAETLLRAASS